MRHQPPRAATPDDVAQPVEHLPQRMLALTGILAQQRQAGRDQRPLLIGNVGRIRLAGRAHPHPSEHQTHPGP
ncbi:hypothetical protein ES708_00120 [subsurface metagenome]